MSNAPLLPAIKLSIDDLYLDPNNPRLGVVGPGYNEPKKLFDATIQAEILEKMGVSSGFKEDPHGVKELILTILKKGWVDNADPIWVWAHPDEPNKYIALEGNRRTCSLKYICGELYQAATKNLLNAQEKDNKKLIKKFEGELEEIKLIRAAAQSLEVKPVGAKTEEELNEALVLLLSIRHISGARQWDQDASDIWLYKKYIELFERHHGTAKELFWDDEIIAPLARDSSLTPTLCKQKLRSISWYEDFKVRFKEQMPINADGKKAEFKKSDYYLFTELCKSIPVRDTILKCSADHVVASDEAAEAIFKWVFKEPSHLDAQNNTNKFYAHRCVGYLAKMKKYDEINNTNFAAGYNIENPDSAPSMRVAKEEFKNAQQNAGKVNLLENLVKQLRSIDIGQIEDEGDTIRGYLTHIRDLTNRILKDIENRND